VPFSVRGHAPRSSQGTSHTPPPGLRRFSRGRRSTSCSSRWHSGLRRSSLRVYPASLTAPHRSQFRTVRGTRSQPPHRSSLAAQRADRFLPTGSFAGQPARRAPFTQRRWYPAPTSWWGIGARPRRESGRAVSPRSGWHGCTMSSGSESGRYRVARREREAYIGAPACEGSHSGAACLVTAAIRRSCGARPYQTAGSPMQGRPRPCAGSSSLVRGQLRVA
jgi:hypothetical protein